MNDLFGEPNYLVKLSSRSEPIPCDTEEQVWDAIGQGPVGVLYSVSSPAGLPVDEFIPF